MCSFFFLLVLCCCVFRRALASRKKRLDEEEESLRHDEQEFQQHVKFFEQRMNELTAMGAKVKQQSAEVAKMYQQVQAEKEEIITTRDEAKKLLQEGTKLKETSTAQATALAEEKKEFEKRNMQLLRDQKNFFVERDETMRATATAKQLQAISAKTQQLAKSLQPHFQSEQQSSVNIPSAWEAVASSQSVPELSSAAPRAHRSQPYSSGIVSSVPYFPSSGFSVNPSPRKRPANFETLTAAEQKLIEYALEHPHGNAELNELDIVDLDTDYYRGFALPHGVTSQQPTARSAPSASGEFYYSNLSAALQQLAEHSEAMKGFLTQEKLTPPGVEVTNEGRKERMKASVL